MVRLLSWSDGTNQVKTDDDPETFMGNPMARQGDPPPPPAATLPEQNRHPPCRPDIVVKAVPLEGFTPLFQRPEMVEGDPLGDPRSIMKRVEDLQMQMFPQQKEKDKKVMNMYLSQIKRGNSTIFQWNGANLLELLEIEDEIREIVAKYKEEDLPQLATLEKQFNIAMESSRFLYAAVASTIMKEEGWNDVPEICKGIQLALKKNQSTSNLVPLYEHAFLVKPKFDQVILDCASQILGAEASTTNVKKLYRLLEKLVLKNAVDSIKDVVRGTIQCDTNGVVCEVLKSLKNNPGILISIVKENYSSYRNGDWIDVKVIFQVKSDTNRHLCEVQIVHKDMMDMRKQGGGHEAYAKFRSLGEVIADLKNEADGDAEVKEMETRLKALHAQKKTKAIVDVARACTKLLLNQIEGDGKLEAEIAMLNASLPELMTRRKFDECAVIQRKINWLIQKMPKQPSAIESALGLRVNTGGAQGEDPYDLSYMRRLYPSVPLNQYVDDGNFHHINKHYPGLQLIHKDPCIFLVPNLLSPEQCKNLIMKGGQFFKHSTTTLQGDEGESCVHEETRSSWDVRIPFDEVPQTQNLFSEVLNIGVKQMEPLKLIMYQKGQFFKPHYDEGGAGHLARRIITMFVYLNTCESGGETNFPRCGIKVQPRAGLGVIHFPAQLNTAKQIVKKSASKYMKAKPSKTKDKPGKMDLRDVRVLHEGMETSGEKYIASQWCFEGDVGQDKLLENYKVTPMTGKVL